MIVPEDSKVLVGYVYPTWYITPLSVEDAAQQGVMQLQRLKGIKYVYVVIDRLDKKRYLASDVNLLTQEYSDLVGKYKNRMDANITLILQHKENNITAEDVFSYIESQEDEYWVFKEQLQGIGYTHQVCVWNNSSGSFSLTAIDVETRLKGKRYLTGST
jgi:hypothetical protein